MENYKYSQKWFFGSEIIHKLLDFVDSSKINKILEIGCFEGISSVFFADNLLNNIESKLICVDPFLTINNNDHQIFFNNPVEQNFDYNIAHSKNSSKITVNKIISDKFFEKNIDMFNFIYIDGCHQLDYIERDMKNSFAALENNGIMWMDDYRGGNGDGTIKQTMDKVLESLSGRYEVIHIGYQLAIRKLY